MPEENELVQEQPKGVDPVTFLTQMLPDGPTPNQVEAWKAATPNGRLRIFTPDGPGNVKGRVFVLRGLNGMQREKIEAGIPPNIVDPEKRSKELTLQMVCEGTVWTNVSKNHQITSLELRAQSAGLPGTLMEIVSALSDYIPPVAIEELSAEL